MQALQVTEGTTGHTALHTDCVGTASQGAFVLSPAPYCATPQLWPGLWARSTPKSTRTGSTVPACSSGDGEGWGHSPAGILILSLASWGTLRGPLLLGPRSRGWERRQGSCSVAWGTGSLRTRVGHGWGVKAAGRAPREQAAPPGKHTGDSVSLTLGSWPLA